MAKNEIRVDLVLGKLQETIKSLDALNKQIEKVSNSTKEAQKNIGQGLDKGLQSLSKNIERSANELEDLDSFTKNLTTSAGTLVTTIATLAATFASQGKVTTKTIEVLAKAEALTKSFASSNLALSKVANISQKTFEGLRTAITKFQIASTKGIQLTGSLAKASVVLNKGILGLTLNLGLASAALLAIGNSLEKSENEVVKFTGKATFLAGVVLGGLSFALTQAILVVADFAKSIGDSLVKANIKASDSFVELEKKTFVFQRTVKGFNKVFGKTIGNTEDWTETIEELSKSTGTSEKSLRAATTEIIAATSALGFNQEQMETLLMVSNDYAAQIGVDTLDATINFIQALNGSSQSVIKYGVKLNAASVQNKLFASGINKSFTELSEGEKVQARYNALLTQYKPIAGVASAVTGTLAGQQKLLDNNITRLNQSLGKGIALVENNNIVNFALNKVLDLVNENVLAAAGFFQALGARILQVGGTLLGLSLKVLLVVKGIKILNILLGTTLAQSITGLPLPFLNKSLTDLLKSTGANFVSFRSLGDIFKTTGSVLLSTSKNIVASFLGIEKGALSISSVLKGVFKKSVTTAIKAVNLLNKAFLKLLANPIVLIIVGIAAAVALLVKGLKIIDEQTGALTQIWEVFTEVLGATSTVLQPLIDLFDTLSKKIIGLVDKAIGRLVQGLAKVLSFGVKLLKKNPFNIFDNKQLAKLESAQNSLNDLSDRVDKAQGSFVKLGEQSKKATDKLNQSIKAVDVEKLSLLQKEIENLGLTEVEKVDKALKERVTLLENARKQELITEKEFQSSKAKLEEQASIDRRKAREDENKEIIAGLNSLTSISQLSIDEAALDLFPDLKESLKQKIKEGLTESEKKLQLTLGIAAELATSFKSGAKAFTKSLIKFAKPFVTAAFGPVGGIIADTIGQVVEIFGDTPEKFREQIVGTIEGIGDLISNILINFANLPQIVQQGLLNLANNMDQVAAALGQSTAAALSDSALWTNVGTEFTLAIIRNIPEMIQGFIDGFRDGFQDFIDLFKGLDKVVAGIKEAFDDIGKVFKDIGNFFEKLFGSFDGDIFKNLGKKIFEGFSELFNLFSPTNLLEKIFKVDLGPAGPVEQFIGLNFPFVEFAKGGRIGGKAKVSGDSSKNDIVPILASPGEGMLPRTVMQGGIPAIIDFAQKNFGMQGGGVITRNVFDEFVGAIGEVVEVLSPEQIFQNLESLAQSATQTFNDIKSGNISAAVQGVIDAAESQIFNLAAAFPFDLLASIGIPLDLLKVLDGLRRIGAKISVVDFVKDPFNFATNFVKSVVDTFLKPFLQKVARRPDSKASGSTSFTGAGSIGIGTVLKGLRTGGKIPPGFPNDSFAAGLTSGELVVDRTDTERLSNFLDSPGADNTDTQLLLNEILSELRKPVKSEAVVELNNREFANILVELSRTNTRVAI